jgi:hypothetical protein
MCFWELCLVFQDHQGWATSSHLHVVPARNSQRNSLAVSECQEELNGPKAEIYDEDKLLARRIQVTKDIVTLLGLCEPSRRGNRVN